MAVVASAETRTGTTEEGRNCGGPEEEQSTFWTGLWTKINAYYRWEMDD